MTATTDGAPTRYDCTHVVSSMPLGRAGQGDGPAAAGRGARRRGRPHLPRLHHRGARRRRPTRCRGTTTGSTSTTPRSRPCGSRTSGRGRPYLVKDGRNVLGLEYTLSRPTRPGPRPTTTSSSRASRSSSTLGLVDAADVEAGYVVRMPKAYPMYDATYKANVETAPNLARASTPPTCTRSGATGCTSTTTRTTRCTRRCCPSRTSSAPTTTSGRQRRGRLPRRAGRPVSRPPPRVRPRARRGGPPGADPERSPAPPTR